MALSFTTLVYVRYRVSSLCLTHIHTLSLPLGRLRQNVCQVINAVCVCSVRNLDNGKQVQTGRIVDLCPSLDASILRPTFFRSTTPPSVATKHTNKHVAFFALVPTCQRHRLLQQTGSCLVCRTRKPLVVIQLPNNHCSVWLLTCVWLNTHTHTRTGKPGHSLFLWSAYTGQSRPLSFSCSR